MEAGGIVPDTDILVSDLRGKTSALEDLGNRKIATTVINAF